MSQQPGQISPDGLWRWDGQHWVPTGAMAPAAPVGRSRAWIWWLGGCAAVVAVVIVGGLFFGGFALYNAARSGAFNCVPSDFPNYRGATLVSIRATSNGSNRTCEIVYATTDSASTVLDVYKSKLSEAPWQVSDTGPSVVDFTNTETGATGTVQVTETSSGSEIVIDYQGP